MEAIPSKNRLNIHSTELLEYLVRTERWHSCEHCLVAGIYGDERTAASHSH
ncbi:MAG TPA: hypothetical protein VM681_10045 [Candidatus Thermoplasmatota archaeon]|nr:hypothetical protein [Candidatus Thermoplasmatota archaeon]